MNPDTGEIRTHDKESPGDEYLFELVTAGTLLNRGTVYVVDPGDLIGPESVAAVFRY